MNQPDSKKIREAYQALLIMIMTFFMILIPMIPSLKAKAAPEMINKIYIYDFDPQVHDELTAGQARSECIKAAVLADDAPFVTNEDNTNIYQDGSRVDINDKLKSGSAVCYLKIYAKPYGNEIPDPDYDFDVDNLDKIEVYINNTKRTDVIVDNYNQWWRGVTVQIPITVSHYTGTKYNVTFDSNGGSSVATQSVAKGCYALEPTAPIYQGKLFQGWYKDAALTQPFGFTYMSIQENMTLYAKWKDEVVTKHITRIDFEDFYPELNNGMTGDQGVNILINSYNHPDDATYSKNESNSHIQQKNENDKWENVQSGILSQGEAIYQARIFAKPYGMEVENPDYDFDPEHLDDIEVYINGVKRTDVSVGDYNQWWRSVSVYIPVTVAKAKDPITGSVTITGTAQYGETLTAKVTGSNATSFNFEWQKENYRISGANSSTYTLTKYDIGTTIKCVVTDATDTYNGELTSAETDVVKKGNGPAAPTGLKAVSPSKKGASDGRITGVSTNMEYSTAKNFSKNVNPCTSNTITGLVAGTYYVRIKESTITSAGNATKIVVADGPEVHTHGGTGLITHPAKEPTCTDPGNSLYYECSCGKFFSDKACTKQISKDSWVIQASGHTWGAVTYSWSADNSQVTAKKVCKKDKNHWSAETANTTYKVIKAASETSTGTGRYTVTFTKSEFKTQTKDVTIEKLSHTHKPTYHEAVKETCTTAGNSEYYSCECGKYFSDYSCTTEINKDSWVIKAAGHQYGAATYAWSADNKTVTATKVCKNNSSHKVTEKVNTTYKVLEDATEKKDGIGQYTATFTKSGFTTQTKKVTISKLSHKHSGTYHAAVKVTCTTAGNSAYYSCKCGKYFSDSACTKEIDKDSWVIKAKGHNYSEATYTWSSDNKTVTGTRVCKNDKSHKITEKVNTTYYVLTEATKTTDGLGQYKATFTKEGFKTQTKDVVIPKGTHQHSGTYHAATAATCEKAGNSAYYSCNCGKYFSDKECTKEINKNSWIIKAKGHNYGEVSYTWSSDNKTVTAAKVCKNDKSHKVTEKVTTTYKVIKDATEKATGVGRYTATFKTEGFKTQTKDVTIPKLNPGQVDVTKKFSDVKAGEWYVNAIQFVFDKKIMNGVSDSQFGTQSVITREQFVTVLYNMEGQPSAKYRKLFNDVPDKQYYSLPVIWAYDNKITQGISKDAFGTGNTITREQLATMLYNYAQYKKLKGVTKNKDLSTFPDYKNISSWAKEGMTWAVSNGIVNGKASNGKNYLDPAGKASRAECAQMIKNLFDNVIKK